MSFLGSGGGPSDDSTSRLTFWDTIRQAFADEELRRRIFFVLIVFTVFALGVNIPAPFPNVNSASVYDQLKNLPMFQLLNVFGGGALRKLSVLSLGLNPYITASIMMQILYMSSPKLKKQLHEGGEYERTKQNKYTRGVSVFLCLFQSVGLLKLMAPALGPSVTLADKAIVVAFWSAGAMFLLWLGEQISERGVGNGVSIMIFAGIILSLPSQAQTIWQGVQTGFVQWWSLLVILIIFLLATWMIVYFTVAQRRIPIEHMRRNMGTKVIGGQRSYLPLSVAMAGVIPIIFALTFVSLPYQLGLYMGGNGAHPTAIGHFFVILGAYLNPINPSPIAPWLPIPIGVIGCILYTVLIFFFTYFWTAMMFNVDDIADNLKRQGSFIQGYRPGKQTKDFLDGVMSRITFVGAGFIAVVALLQYLAPAIAMIPQGNYISIIGGTSLLIMVQVALETMRIIESNLLVKQYN